MHKYQETAHMQYGYWGSREPGLSLMAVRASNASGKELKSLSTSKT